MKHVSVYLPDELYTLILKERVKRITPDEFGPTFSRTIVELIHDGLKARAKREAPRPRK